MNLEIIEESRLSELGIFNADDINLFKEYNIFTIEQLLGATRGLKNIKIFNEISDSENKLKKLKEKILDLLLKEYREFNKEYPMGVLVEGDNNEVK